MNQTKRKPSKACTSLPPSKVTQVAGDAFSGKGQNKKPKNCGDIPKNLRYDLESALIGLCDVWFEEIKPYLIKNKIKLHLNHTSPDGDDDQDLPAGASGCTHLDPGFETKHSEPIEVANGRPLTCTIRQRHRTVNCVGFSSTPPTASRARCVRRSAMPKWPTVPRSQQANVTTQIQNHNLKNESKLKQRRHEDQYNLGFKGMCRNPIPVSNTANYKINTGVTTKTTSPGLEKHNGALMKTKSPVLDKCIQTSCAIDNQNRMVNKNKSKKIDSACVGRPLSTRPPPTHADAPSFKEDLAKVDDNNKRLRLLYKSPTREECPSVVNLCSSPLNEHRRQSRKTTPWK